MNASETATHVVAAAAALLACAAAAAAGRNLGFEDGAAATEPAGWSLRMRGAAAAADSDVVFDGARSLRLELDAADADARLTQRVATAGLAGNRVRISAEVRSDGLEHGDTSLWVRVDGAGQLLYVDRGSERIAARAGTGWRTLVLEAPLAANAEHLEFGADVDGRGRVWLDGFRVDAYDTAELPPPSAAATRYVERALAIMRANSLRRAQVDWPALRAATLAQARGASAPADTYLALQFALTSLGDGHSYFMPPERMRRLAREPASNARTGRPAVPALHEPLGERVGYVRVPGYAGGSQAEQAAFADDVQGRIEALDTPARCGWIVDLRGNSGGNLWPMLAGLGPLLGDGDVGAAVHPGGTREPIAYRDGKVSLDGYVQLRVRREPYRVERPDAPVAVLMDGRTASSGEIVALFLTARENARSFGSATRGVATATRTFPLADGAALILTVAATSDSRGRIADGPLEPDVAIDSARGRSSVDTAQPLNAARDWLGNRYACS